jgi:hypothetical protein
MCFIYVTTFQHRSYSVQVIILGRLEALQYDLRLWNMSASAADHAVRHVDQSYYVWKNLDF